MDPYHKLILELLEQGKTMTEIRKELSKDIDHLFLESAISDFKIKNPNWHQIEVKGNDFLPPMTEKENVIVEEKGLNIMFHLILQFIIILALVYLWMRF